MDLLNMANRTRLFMCRLLNRAWWATGKLRLTRDMMLVMYRVVYIYILQESGVGLFVCCSFWWISEYAASTTRKKSLSDGCPELTTIIIVGSQSGCDIPKGVSESSFFTHWKTTNRQLPCHKEAVRVQNPTKTIGSPHCFFATRRRNPIILPTRCNLVVNFHRNSIYY